MTLRSAPARRRRGPGRLAADAAQLCALRRAGLSCPSWDARPPADLSTHHCITGTDAGASWRFNGPGRADRGADLSAGCR